MLCRKIVFRLQVFDNKPYTQRCQIDSPVAYTPKCRQTVKKTDFTATGQKLSDDIGFHVVDADAAFNEHSADGVNWYITYINLKLSLFFR